MLKKQGTLKDFRIFSVRYNRRKNFTDIDIFNLIVGLIGGHVQYALPLMYFIPAQLSFVYFFRYTLLVGRPPFETSCLKDTYMRIRNNEYAIPSRITRSAAKLIQRLLSERPEDRPSLNTVLNDEFFTRGFFPKSLPSICCVAPPKFTSLKNRNSQCSNKRHKNSKYANRKRDGRHIDDAMAKISLRDKYTEDEQQHESGIDSQDSNGNIEEALSEEGAIIVKLNKFRITHSLLLVKWQKRKFIRGSS